VSNLTGKAEVASRILAALVSRPDSGLFNYDEMADMAVQYAEALEKRIRKDELANQAAQAAEMRAQLMTGAQLEEMRGVMRGSFPAVRVSQGKDGGTAMEPIPAKEFWKSYGKFP